MACWNTILILIMSDDARNPFKVHLAFSLESGKAHEVNFWITFHHKIKKLKLQSQISNISYHIISRLKTYQCRLIGSMTIEPINRQTAITFYVQYLHLHFLHTLLCTYIYIYWYLHIYLLLFFTFTISNLLRVDL